MTLLILVSFGCALATFAVAAFPRAAGQGANAAPQPVSIAIVYDTSTLAGYPDGGRRSFGRQKKALFAALADFVRQDNPRNEYFIVRFDTVPHLYLGGTADKEFALKVISKLSSLGPGGATSLFDACLLAADQVARGKHDRRAIILMSDGMDTVSKHTLKDVADELAGSKIALYAVNIGRPDPKHPSINFYPRGDEVLNTLASASNGALFRLGGDKEKIEVFQAIAAKLRDGSPGGPR